MNRVVIPGSFDPVTSGHLDIFKRASEMFDEVIVLIMKNVNKKGMFSYSQRKELLELSIKELKNVTVDINEGLLTDYMKKNGITKILKGLRNEKDFEYEYDMALINRKLLEDSNTLFLISDPKYIMVSSSAVRELISYGASLSGFVPKEIEPIIFKIAAKG